MTPLWYCQVVLLSPIDSRPVCGNTAITVLIIEQATNLGFKIWLITSGNADFIYRESSSSAASLSSISLFGCPICIITLVCGMQIHTEHTIIISDLATCSTIPAINLAILFAGSAGIIDHANVSVKQPTLYILECKGRSDCIRNSTKTLISSPRVRHINH